MKNVFSLALTLMLAVCLALPAYAHSSIAVSVDVGQGLTVSKDEVPQAAATAIEKNLTATLESAGITVPSGQTATPVFLQDLTGEPGTYTFTVNNAGPNDKVYVLHYENSKWVKVGEGTGKTVKATFKSLSPVAVILVRGKNSPQTGAPMAVPFIGLAVIALAGIVAFKARKKEM